MAGHGQVFEAPVDVQFDDFNVVEPDLVIVMNDNRIVTPTKIKGVPELVVEILSPSTKTRGQALKKELYEQHGVPEFWIVDADDHSVLCCRLSGDGNYAPPSKHTSEISLTIGPVIAQVDLSKVW